MMGFSLGLFQDGEIEEKVQQTWEMQRTQQLLIRLKREVSRLFKNYFRHWADR